MTNRRTFLKAALTMSAVAATQTVTGFAALAKDKLKSGSFRGANGVRTSGGVSVVKSGSKQQVVLSGNFSTKKGPSLWVYVGNGSPTKRVAKLKKIKGSQTYSLPAGVDIGKYSNVYIYCVPFKKTFGKARLK